MTNNLLERYWKAVDDHKLYASSENLRFYLECTFQDVSFAGKKVLDIGAGAGLCSFYAASLGAEKVVSLEPEAAGSTAGVSSDFNKLSAALGLQHVKLYPVTIQEFDPGHEKFDVIILDDSINHLDEAACIRLHLNDKSAIESYTAIFQKISDMAASGAKLVITDCSRHNIFPLLGLKNPITPTIEWHKHQSPPCWIGLLSGVGFRNPKVWWRSPNRLGSAGKLLLGNKVAAFFLWSRFSLTMEKP